VQKQESLASSDVSDSQVYCLETNSVQLDREVIPPKQSEADGTVIDVRSRVQTRTEQQRKMYISSAIIVED